MTFPEIGSYNTYLQFFDTRKGFYDYSTNVLQFESNRGGNVEGNCEIERVCDDYVLLRVVNNAHTDIISVPLSKLVIIDRLLN